jgi:hypothetical protein
MRVNHLMVLAGVLAASLASPVHAQTFTTFAVPGAVNTDPESINLSGTVTGYYSDENGQLHGFVRHQPLRCWLAAQSHCCFRY